MKGPYERSKYDFDRQWLCPRCGRSHAAPGHLTSHWCDCRRAESLPAVAMQLVGEGGRRIDWAARGVQLPMPTLPADSAPSAVPPVAMETSGSVDSVVEDAPAPGINAEAANAVETLASPEPSPPPAFGDGATAPEALP